ncbi:MarR family transcriptional regulator [Pontibaca salina]|uniref:MarR family transcriptional regulator n=1 Tax=Pontibaca salina TaxID=2795731 RepID=A0A934HNM3_9RHOB|nr:MarR family transcriptional regulator [Pontibaca salina]MBI6628907.1 MarR family transcriptional regulator [Pontibaca salina]
MPEPFAVLTGDLIDSTSLDLTQLNDALQALENASRDIAGWGGGIVTGFARRGGDGWQCAIAVPALSLRAALFLRAALRELGKSRSTRIAIAEGLGTLPADRNPNSGHGPAFIASGRLLATLPAHVAMAHAAKGDLAAAVRLADHISSGWTPAQARAVRLMLWPRDRIRADAAKHLGITRQAVNQALWGAGFPAIDDALRMIEAKGCAT